MAFHQASDSDSDNPILAEINVTPLVDVMLVLLIIFMVAAPMLHQGIEVALPQAQARPLPMRSEDPMVLSITRDGLIYVKDVPVHSSQLVERLLPMLEVRGDESVFLKGDRDVPYGSVMEVLDILHQAGIQRIGMVTEQSGSTIGGR